MHDFLLLSSSGKDESSIRVLGPGADRWDVELPLSTEVVPLINVKILKLEG